MSAETDRWKRVEELFDQALSIEPGGRSVWLAGRCEGFAGLAEEVQSLLDSYEEQEQLQPSLPEDPPTRRFGVYEIERSIGQGGMGSVYLAHRADGQFDQRVAIKVVGRQVFGDVFLERFRLERQILASLNHPNISRLLDGGVAADGALYLAMEYVEGVPIDRYCEDKNLGLPARLRLFQSVCAGVQYAHRNLVVHRDLKPDNILVQNDGVPKLLDFGTAKLLTPIAEAADSELTQAGFRAFTPAYASPEQVLGSPVTTASDIYSLGVILYRLAAGRPPYELKDYTTGELVKVVCEREPQPARINPDVDAIIAKCLRKDPAARYRSVDELIDDIGFHLGGRPVGALRGGFSYRLRKFVQRNKVVSAVSVLLAGSVVFGIAGVLWEANIASARYQDLRRLTNTLLFELNDVIRELPGSTAAQHLLVTKVLDNLDKLASGSSRDRLLQSDLVEAYRKLGNLQGNPYEQNLGDMEGGLATLKKALAISDRLLTRNPRDQDALRAQARIRQSMGDMAFGSGRVQEAVQNQTEAAAAFDRLAATPGAPAELITEAAVAYETLGDEYGQPGAPSMGDVASAFTQYRKSLDLDERALAADPNYFRARRAMAVIRMKIGTLQLNVDPEQARDSFLEAVRMFDRLPEKEAASLSSRRIQATLLRKAGNAFEALEEWDPALDYYTRCLRIEETFAAVDPEDSRGQLQLAVILNSISAVQEGRGDLKSAYETANRVRAILEGVVRRDPNGSASQSRLGEALQHLARLLRRLGNTGEAARVTARVVEISRALAARSDASARDLCQAGIVLASAEPVSYRDPALAVRYAEECAQRSGRRDPENLRILAGAYGAAGRAAERRKAAQEGLALMPPGKHRGWIARQLEELAK